MDSLLNKAICFFQQNQAATAKGLPRPKPGERFLKGPIPFSWLGRAMRLPGKALHVAIVVWHLAEMKKSRVIALSNAVLRENGVRRHAGYLGLAALEKEGLVTVSRHNGRNSIVTILEQDAVSDKDNRPCEE